MHVTTANCLCRLRESSAESSPKDEELAREPPAAPEAEVEVAEAAPAEDDQIDKGPMEPPHGGSVITKAVNSTNYRREYHVLKRVAEGPRAVEYPNIAKLFLGTNAEQKQVLKAFLLSGGNLDAVEAHVTAETTHLHEVEGVRELLTIDGMRKAGCSELPGSSFAHLVLNLLNRQFRNLLCGSL